MFRHVILLDFNLRAKVSRQRLQYTHSCLKWVLVSIPKHSVNLFSSEMAMLYEGFAFLLHLSQSVSRSIP